MYIYASCGLPYLREVGSFICIVMQRDNDAFSDSKSFYNNHTALHISQSAFISTISIDLQNPEGIPFVLQIRENGNA